MVFASSVVLDNATLAFKDNFCATRCVQQSLCFFDFKTINDVAIDEKRTGLKLTSDSSLLDVSIDERTHWFEIDK